MRTRYNVNPEQVVSVWNRSQTAQEAADVLKMKKSALIARIINYRRKYPQIKLKKMPRGAQKRINVEALLKAAEESYREHQEKPSKQGKNGKKN